VSERKEKAHWVQNIIHHPKIMFTVNSKSFEGIARAVDKLAEHKLTKHISSLMDAKYGWSNGLQLVKLNNIQSGFGSIYQSSSVNQFD
jgi:hypothetical protein